MWDQELDDMTQAVWLTLLEHDGRTLHGWRPEGGLSLANYVGLVAERRVTSLLRNRRTNPWTEEPADNETMERALPPSCVSETAEHRELLRRLNDGLRATVTPETMELFVRLIVNEEDVQVVSSERGTACSATYTMKSRLLRLARATLTRAY